MFCLTVEKAEYLPDVFFWATVNRTVSVLMPPVVVRKPALNNAVTLEVKKPTH